MLDFRRDERRMTMIPTAKLRHAYTSTPTGRVELHQAELHYYADYPIPCGRATPPLTQNYASLKEAAIAALKVRFRLRVCEAAAIRECARGSETYCCLLGESYAVMGEMPAQERLVYFMRDIPEYSTGDTSLLIGITKAQVEILLSFARKRFDMTDGSSSLESQAPEWTYFRFEERHLG